MVKEEDAGHRCRSWETCLPCLIAVHLFRLQAPLVSLALLDAASSPATEAIPPCLHLALVSLCHNRPLGLQLIRRGTLPLSDMRVLRTHSQGRLSEVGTDPHLVGRTRL